MRALHKGTRLRYDELGKMCNKNLFALDFLIVQAEQAEAGQTAPPALAAPGAQSASG